MDEMGGHLNSAGVELIHHMEKMSDPEESRKNIWWAILPSTSAKSPCSNDG
jgi:hypothetical protein